MAFFIVFNEVLLGHVAESLSCENMVFICVFLDGLQGQ